MPSTSAPDLTEFHALSYTKKRLCKVGPALVALNGEVKTLQAALDANDPTSEHYIPPGAISKWLAKRDHPEVTVSAVRSHRDGTCSCVHR